MKQKKKNLRELPSFRYFGEFFLQTLVEIETNYLGLLLKFRINHKIFKNNQLKLSFSNTFLPLTTKRQHNFLSREFSIV